MSEHNEPPVDAEDRSSDDKLPTQRRIFGTRRIANPASTENPPELEEKIAHLVDSVKVLQSHITGAKPAGETPVETEPKQKRMKRFQRSASEDMPGAEGEPPFEHEMRDDEATQNKNIAWPRLTRADEAGATQRAGAAATGRRNPVIIWVLVQLTGLGLLLLGFWAGQSFTSDDEEHPSQSEAGSPAKSAGADSLARVGINDRALEAARLGLHAEKTGDLVTARQTWETAIAGEVTLPGADYRLAMLDVQRNDLASADIHLSNSLAAGEMMASCYFVNACFAGKKGDYNGAAKQLALSVRVEPFSAKYLFCWGEALRRAGKAQAGISAISQALDRPASPADVELITFKLRLAKIEVGHDDAFDAEIAAQLARTPVAGDWLLLAAARDLSRSAFPAAAAHLKAAAAVMKPELYNLLVQDFAFQGYAKRADVSALVNVPLPPPSVGPMDPGAWPPEEADPAVWPPFSPAL